MSQYITDINVWGGRNFRIEKNNPNYLALKDADTIEDEKTIDVITLPEYLKYLEKTTPHLKISKKYHEEAKAIDDLLNAEKTEDREKACKVLERIGDKTDLPALIEALRQRTESINKSIRPKVLEKDTGKPWYEKVFQKGNAILQTKTFDEVKQAWNQPTESSANDNIPEKKIFSGVDTVFLLGKFRDKSAVPYILDYAKAINNRKNKYNELSDIAIALGMIGDDGAVPLLADLIKSNKIIEKNSEVPVKSTTVEKKTNEKKKGENKKTDIKDPFIEQRKCYFLFGLALYSILQAVPNEKEEQKRNITKILGENGYSTKELRMWYRFRNFTKRMPEEQFHKILNNALNIRGWKLYQMAVK